MGLWTLPIPHFASDRHQSFIAFTYCYSTFKNASFGSNIKVNDKVLQTIRCPALVSRKNHCHTALIGLPG